MSAEEIIAQIKEAINNEEIPSIYFNNFIFTVGSADAALVLRIQDKSVAVLHLSHATAKTLAQKLGETIALIEESSDNLILTTDEFTRRTQKGGNSETDK